MPGAGPGHERRAVRGLEQHVQFAAAREETVEVGGQEAAGPVRPSIDFPVAPQFDEQPLAVHGGVGVVGLLDLHEFPVAAQQQLVRPKRDLSGHEVALEPGGEVAIRPHAHVVGLSLEHDGRVGERRAPPPFAHRPRVARGGERAGAEVGGHEQALTVAPRHAALGLGQAEAIGDEPAGLEVELADDVGVGAAPGERHEAQAVLRLEHRRPVPDPVFVFGRGEGVEVEDGLPRRLGLPVFLRRGPPPDALRMFRVAPEVVEPIPDLRHHRDPLLRVEDSEQPRLEPLEIVRLGERPHALRIPLAHPRELLLPRHVLEPEMRVGRRFGGGG